VTIYNRWFQLCASLVAMVMIANLQYSWTLFVEPMRTATGWKLSDIQWAFTLFILFQTWVQPAQGFLIDRMGPRVFTTLAQNGTVQMPFQPTFWAKGFGMLIDRFGTPWILNADQQIN